MTSYFSQIKRHVDSYITHFRDDLEQDQKALRGFIRFTTRLANTALHSKASA